jgi:hypothetical protein
VRDIPAAGSSRIAGFDRSGGIHRRGQHSDWLWIWSAGIALFVVGARSPYSLSAEASSATAGAGGMIASTLAAMSRR